MSLIDLNIPNLFSSLNIYMCVCVYSFVCVCHCVSKYVYVIVCCRLSLCGE